MFSLKTTLVFFFPDGRLAKFAKEKSELQDQISHLKLELEEEKNRRRKNSSNSLMNGPSSEYDYDDLQSINFFIVLIHLKNAYIFRRSQQTTC